MKQIKTLIGELETQIAAKVAKLEFEITEFKRAGSVIIDVDGVKFSVILNNHKKEVVQVAPEKQNIKLILSEEQSQKVYEKINEEVELQEYNRLKAKLGK